MQKTKNKRAYRTVSIQDDLISKIEGIITDVPGYNSLSDFVSDALRRRLDELEKIKLVAEEYELEEGREWRR